VVLTNVVVEVIPLDYKCALNIVWSCLGVIKVAKWLTSAYFCVCSNDYQLATYVQLEGCYPIM